MKPATVMLVALALLLAEAGRARAGIVTFDDVVSNSGATQVPNSWDYAGLNFSSSFFQGVWGDLNEQGARDGTPVFIYGFATQTIRTTDGSPFSLEQLDIGLSFFTNPSENVTVTLNFAGGGSSSFNLSLTQNFQTLILNASNLSSIQISSPNTSLGYVALDNIVFNEPANLPEPSTLALFGMAAATFAGYCGWRRRKQPVSA